MRPQSDLTQLIPADRKGFYEGHAAHGGFRVCDSSGPVQTHLGGKACSCPANPGRFLAGSSQWLEGASCSSYGGLS